MRQENKHTDLPDAIWVGNNPLNNTYHKTETTYRSRHGKVVRVKYHADHVVNKLYERNAELLKALELAEKKLGDLKHQDDGVYDVVRKAINKAQGEQS